MVYSYGVLYGVFMWSIYVVYSYGLFKWCIYMVYVFTCCIHGLLSLKGGGSLLFHIIVRGDYLQCFHVNNTWLLFFFIHITSS